ncbi:MAG: hypothetical protein NVSMB38_24740 [Ktedonobacteraceae bacterium]
MLSSLIDLVQQVPRLLLDQCKIVTMRSLDDILKPSPGFDRVTEEEQGVGHHKSRFGVGLGT